MTAPLMRTSLEGLRITQFDGRSALEAHQFLQRFIQQRLGSEYAAFLAEPLCDNDGVVWYTDRAGDPVNVADLTSDQRAAIEDKALDYLQALDTLAADLEAQGTRDEARMGAMLKAAIQTPSNTEGLLFAVGDEPVLIGWGARDDTPNPPSTPMITILTAAQAQRRSLSAPFLTESESKPEPEPLRPPPPEPKESKPEVIERVVFVSEPRDVLGRDWLTPSLWMLFTVLLLGIYVMLFQACGFLFLQGSFGYCTPTIIVANSEPRDDSLDRLLAKNRQLEERIDATRRVASTAPDCNRQLTERNNLVDPEVEERRTAQGGAVGAVTVTLIWDDPADLDLYLQCPDGVYINHQNTQACGGELDVDKNAGGVVVPKPVENITLQKEGWIAGQYHIQVKSFSVRPESVVPTPFKVQVRFERETGVPEVKSYDNLSVGKDDIINVGQFSVP